MDKEVLEKILNLKKKKEPFCLVSKANSTDTKGRYGWPNVRLSLDPKPGLAKAASDW